MTYRTMNTSQGWLLVRTEPSGYELVWEVHGTRRAAAEERRRHWTYLEATR